MPDDSPFPPGAHVAAYLRDSGGEEQELSVTQQEQAIRDWCSQHGLILTRVFKDEAAPGSSVVGRAAFQELMTYFRGGAKESGLIIWKYSRFARDVDDAQFYKADLRRRGYVIHSLNDNIPNGPEGRFFEAAIDWMNARFLEDLSTDVKRGLRHIVEQYGCVPGTPPRGFKREPVAIGLRRDGTPHIAHKWVPDPEIAPLIRRAFEMRAAGATMKQIHAELHLYNSLNSYTTFFRNKLYTGVLEYGGKTYENYCDPIVDKTTFERVQEIMRQHARRVSSLHPRRQNSSFLLSGLLYCAKCGAPMSGHKSKQRNGTYYRRYECTRSARHAGCDAKRIPAKRLEDAVIAEVMEYILDPETVRAAVELAKKNRDERRHEMQALRKSLKKQLAALRRQIHNLVNAIAKSGHSRALLEKLQRMETEEGEIMARLQTLQTAFPPIPSADLTDFERLGEFSRRLRERLPQADTIAKRNILRGFVHKITAERIDKEIRGLIEWYLPTDEARPPPDKTVPMDTYPVGAPLHRHGTACLKQIPSSDGIFS